MGLKAKIPKNEAKAEFRDSDKFEILFNNAPDAYFLFDGMGSVVNGNIAAEKMFKLKKVDILHKNLSELDFLSPDEYKKAAKLLTKSMNGMKALKEEFIINLGNGKKIEIEVMVCPVKSEGKILFLTIARDITERKAAENRIKSDEKIIKSILDAVPHAVIGLDNRRMVFANESVKNVFGWKTEELMGKNTRIFYRNDKEYEELGRILYPMLATQKKFSIEYTCRHKDGRDIMCLISATIIGDKFDNRRVVVMYEDITDRKKAVNSYFRERERMREYLDIANLIVISISVDRKVHLVNKKGCDILGYEEAEILGKDWFENFVPKNIRNNLEKVFSGLLSGNKASEVYENSILTKDGKERIIRWHNVLLKDTNENIIEVLSTGEDITEHKIYESALKESEMKFKVILENIQSGIIIIDSEKREIADINPQAVRMIGLPKEKIIGKICHGFICAAEKGKCPIIDLGKTVINEECELLRADKTRITILKSVIKIEMGGKKYLVDSFVDISEQKKSREESEKKISEMERFSKLTIGRELKMVELKNRIKELEEKLGIKT